MGSGDAIWDWDVARDRIYVSPEIEVTLGLERGAMQTAARKWLPFLHPNDRDRFRATLDTLVDRRRGRCVQDFRLRTEADHYRWMRLRARPIVGGDGEVLRCVGTLADVTSEREGLDRMLHDAVHDNLTGLPNRELFNDRLATAMERARAEDLARPTVLVVDIDRFVKVNEAFGHSVADSVLLTLARRLQRTLKAQDTLGRVTGDMFGVVLLSETDPAAIAKVAEGLRRAVRHPVTFGTREIVLTASVGIAAMDKRHTDAGDLLRDAETAMRAAKRQGMDRIEAYTPAMQNDAFDRLTLEADLRRALERGEITLLYQPIVALEDNTVAGFEALMRWDHPKLGRLSPGDFLALAEETDLIGPLGLFALQQTARHLERLAGADRRAFRLRLRQRVEPPAPQPRARQRRQERHRSQRPARGRAAARGHGIARHGEPGVRSRAPTADARPRRRALARRLRHRLFLARLPATLPLPDSQGRSLLRAGRRRQARRAAALDRRARPRSRPRGRRGGRRDAGTRCTICTSSAANTRRASSSARPCRPTTRCGPCSTSPASTRSCAPSRPRRRSRTRPSRRTRAGSAR